MLRLSADALARTSLADLAAIVTLGRLAALPEAEDDGEVWARDALDEARTAIVHARRAIPAPVDFGTL